MICLKLHNLCYILNPNQGREHCNTSLESLKHDNMTLFYKKCQKNGYETSYSPETAPNFNFIVETSLKSLSAYKRDKRLTRLLIEQCKLCNLQTLWKCYAYAMQRLCKVYANTVQKLYKSYAKACNNYAIALQTLYSLYMQTLCKWYANALQTQCKSYASAMQRLFWLAYTKKNLTCLHKSQSIRAKKPKTNLMEATILSP